MGPWSAEHSEGRDRHRADSHKRTRTMMAVAQVGRRLGERTVKATSDGHLELLRWSAQWPQVTFALEDCRHLTEPFRDSWRL
jgi:hypothetical protein